MSFFGKKSIDYYSEQDSSESFQVKTLSKKTKGGKKGTYQMRKNRKNRSQRHMWTLKQTQAYICFVSENKREFESETLRRRNKYFEKMAKSIQTRTPNQCKSHQQKMIQKYGQNFEIFLQQIQKSLFKKYDNIETNSTLSQQLLSPFHSKNLNFLKCYQIKKFKCLFRYKVSLKNFARKNSLKILFKKYC